MQVFKRSLFQLFYDISYFEVFKSGVFSSISSSASVFQYVFQGWTEVLPNMTKARAPMTYMTALMMKTLFQASIVCWKKRYNFRITGITTEHLRFRLSGSQPMLEWQTHKCCLWYLWYLSRFRHNLDSVQADLHWIQTILLRKAWLRSKVVPLLHTDCNQWRSRIINRLLDWAWQSTSSFSWLC